MLIRRPIRQFAALLLCLFAAFAFSACGKIPNSGDGRLHVLVSINALKEFTQAVGKEKVEVTTIVPDGMEPHDFELKAQDLEALSKARVFVYNGLNMETWADDAIKAANNKNLIAVEASKGANPILAVGIGQYDPHLWLSLKGAELETQNIRDALIAADPANKSYYIKNSEEYIGKLESLYGEYSMKFNTVSRKCFVTGHAAFAYLCRDFGLVQKSVQDIFAEGEPSPQKLAQLADYCKENHIKTIFEEDMVSPDITRTLASELGAAVQTIDTIESGGNGKSYLERMSENLSKIYESLKDSAGAGD